MPRYYFHIEDGEPSMDLVGIELANEQVARLSAAVMTGEMLCDDAAALVAAGRCQVEVTDEWGVPLFRLKVEVEELGRPRADG